MSALPSRWCIALLLFTATAAHAADTFEIQVYQGEHNEPLQPSLELHLNDTLIGHTAPSYPGETPLDGAQHLTYELALGVTDWLELGAYLQVGHSPAAGGEFGGWKLRAKLVAPERLHWPVRLGLNIEVGRVPVSVEPEGWANEFRPIIGVDFGRWSMTLNPIIGFALTGPDAFKPELEPALKVAFDTRLGFAVGAEYYASLGRFDLGFSPLVEQEHLAFLALDLVPPPGAPPSWGGWELNLGVGTALTRATPQQLIVKAIFGRAF